MIFRPAIVMFLALIVILGSAKGRYLLVEVEPAAGDNHEEINTRKYVLKPANQVCTSNEIIDNLDECKLAINQLNLDFGYSVSWVSFPKGCFQYNSKSFWNDHNYRSASALSKWRTNAICKTGTSIGAGYIPESCKEHITWALETGKDDANTHYPELEMITGEKPQYATFEDFQRYFKCKNVQRDSCNDKGLDFPSTCSFPPCDQCSIGLEVPTTKIKQEGEMCGPDHGSNGPDHGECANGLYCAPGFRKMYPGHCIRFRRMVAKKVPWAKTMPISRTLKSFRRRCRSTIDCRGMLHQCCKKLVKLGVCKTHC